MLMAQNEMETEMIVTKMFGAITIYANTQCLRSCCCVSCDSLCVTRNTYTTRLAQAHTDS